LVTSTHEQRKEWLARVKDVVTSCFPVEADPVQDA